MYRDRFAQHDVEACCHRSDVRTESGRESAACALVVEITGLLAEACRVDRTACEACCRSFVPTAEKPNPVVASQVYAAAGRMAEAGGGPGLSAERAKALREAALGNLPTPSKVDYVRTIRRFVCRKSFASRCLRLRKMSSDRIRVRRYFSARFMSALRSQALDAPDSG
jgi:hypothetical protein